MKYCAYCGHEMDDQAVMCVNCGSLIYSEQKTPSYCDKCGTPIKAGMWSCPNCREIVNINLSSENNIKDRYYEIKTAAKILMIITCWLTAIIFLLGIVLFFTKFSLIGRMFMLSGLGLIWMIPMTVHYSSFAESKRYVGVGFKILTILFVNVVAGILMLIVVDQKSKD